MKDDIAMRKPRWIDCGVTVLALTTLVMDPGRADDADSKRPKKRSTEKIDFDRDIRPILSDTCFNCHGPDAKQRKGDLRLDVETHIKTDRGGYRLVVPGKPQQSELWKRITSDDPDLRMPPADSRRQLTRPQIELLSRWIEQGAVWRKHWSFVPPKRPRLPDVKNRNWPRNGIDYFVLSRLDAEGLKPSIEASRTTLLRRASFDLTGLPPSLEEIDEFLEDQSPDAYERAVDRLLDSPRYGERMAMQWLDLARYADTNGYQVDNGRSLWRWRDWVIESFNSNMPFDQFTVEQIAGDLLPAATLDQRIATGFNRNHPTTFEGGVIPEEYRVEYVVDRVNTTFTVWQGLTIGCARCHDHKYDPVSQREFYQVFAYFNNVPERGLDGAKGNSVPEIEAPTMLQRRRLAEIADEVDRLKSALNARLPEVDAEQIAWERKTAAKIPVRWAVLRPSALKSSAGSTLKTLDDQSVLAGGSNPNRDTYEVAAHTKAERITGIQLEALKHESLPGGGTGRHPNSNFVLSEVELEIVSLKNSQQKTLVKFAVAHADYSQKGWIVANLVDGKINGSNGWAVDGPSKRENRLAWLIPRQPFGFVGGTELRFKLHNEFPQAAIGRFRLAISTDEKPYKTMMAAGKVEGGLPADIAQIISTEVQSRSAVQRQRLKVYYRTEHWSGGKQLGRQLAALQKQATDLQAKIPKTMVMQDAPQPRDAFLLIRGQYDRRGDKVDPGTPAALNPLPDGAPSNRIGLARWLVDPRNPLTARVMVNRFWQMHFGTGIVKTSEDFGVQGERPTHPELLDWLATEFIRTGWNVKTIQRLIVTSSTYRQSSRFSTRSAADPNNRLLSRGPRMRLPAEMIRDNALAVSGLLVEHLGGPSVKPYQPAGLWKELSSGGSYTAQVFQQDRGRDLYRRSMYTFWKRASPPPALQLFDAPTREYCAVDRSRTNTPLQALVLMNDPTYLEASRAMAERVMHGKNPSVETRVIHAFRLATSRRPSDFETSVLSNAYRARLDEYRQNRPAAEKLLSVGESQRNPQLDLCELAAWTTVSSILLNLDETITKD